MMTEHYVATFILSEANPYVVDEGVKTNFSENGIESIDVHPHTSPGTDSIPDGTEVIISKVSEDDPFGKDLGTFNVTGFGSVAVEESAREYDRFRARDWETWRNLQR